MKVKELIEKLKEEKWLGCERLLCLMGLVLGIIGLGTCFVAIFYISILK